MSETDIAASRRRYDNAGVRKAKEGYAVWVKVNGQQRDLATYQSPSLAHGVAFLADSVAHHILLAFVPDSTTAHLLEKLDWEAHAAMEQLFGVTLDEGRLCDLADAERALRHKEEVTAAVEKLPRQALLRLRIPPAAAPVVFNRNEYPQVPHMRAPVSKEGDGLPERARDLLRQGGGGRCGLRRPVDPAVPAGETRARADPAHRRSQLPPLPAQRAAFR